MFERYTERARRVIFFARYEASQFGSPYIETEHLLFGLFREDPALVSRFVGPAKIAAEIRTEIEKQITRREYISTSVEIPLTPEGRKVLTLASEEADRLGQRYVGTEHMLLGILRLEGSLPARLLQERGLKLSAIRESLAKTAHPGASSERSSGPRVTLDNFLAGLMSLSSEDLISFFADDAEFIDASGKRWNHESICKEFETLFAPYGKKNATYAVEATLANTSELFITNVLWKNALLASEQRAWLHRMTVVLLPRSSDWKILLAQVTPVQSSQAAAGATD
jgi:hypothetical protein